MDNRLAYTIREGKITELPKSAINHNREYEFDSRKDAIRFQVASGNVHNLTKEEKTILEKDIEFQAFKKGYSVLKEHDDTYTIFNQRSMEEEKNVPQKYIYKEINSLENLMTHERKVDLLNKMGRENTIDDFRSFIEDEITGLHKEMEELYEDYRFYSDSHNDQADHDKASYAIGEYEEREEKLKDFIEVAHNFDIEIEKPNIREFANKTHENISEKKIDLSKTAKDFREKFSQKNQVKNKGRERG